MSEALSRFEEARARLHAEIQALGSEINPSKLLHSIDELRALVHQRLGPRLQRARAGKYAFASGLEAKLGELTRDVDELASRLTSEVRRGCDEFTQRFRRLREESRILEHGPSPGGDIWLHRWEDEAKDLRRDLQALGERAQAEVGDLPLRQAAVSQQLAQIEGYLELASRSSVALQAGEHLYVAVAAEWKKGKSSKENPDGLFVVTDRRILMERSEKEGGFLGFGGRKVQELLWELPLAQVQSIRPEQRGLLGAVDLIHIMPAPGAGLEGETTIEVKKGVDADDFARIVRKALDGSLEEERVVP